MQPLGGQNMALDQRLKRLQNRRTGAHLVGQCRHAQMAPQLLDLELEVADERFRARQVRLGIGRFGTGIGELGLRLNAGGTLGDDHRMRGGKIGGERFAGHADDGITFVIIRKLKALPDRCRPPRLLGVPPINAGQQVTELRGRDRHHAIRRRWPQKASPFQTLREQARTLAIVPDHLQQVAATAPEAKQMSAQRVAAKHLLHLKGQTRKALPHVGVPGGQPYPHAGRNGNHRRRLVFASALISADTIEASTDPVIASGRRSQTRSRPCRLAPAMELAKVELLPPAQAQLLPG
jgi:hypothetical protein